MGLGLPTAGQQLREPPQAIRARDVSHRARTPAHQPTTRTITESNSGPGGHPPETPNRARLRVVRRRRAVARRSAGSGRPESLLHLDGTVGRLDAMWASPHDLHVFCTRLPRAGAVVIRWRSHGGLRPSRSGGNQRWSVQHAVHRLVPTAQMRSSTPAMARSCSPDGDAAAAAAIGGTGPPT